MSELIKKGIYINKEHTEELAALVYQSRKGQKRFVNESMLVRIGLELLFKAQLDFNKFENEMEVREFLRQKELVFK